MIFLQRLIKIKQSCSVKEGEVDITNNAALEASIYIYFFNTLFYPFREIRAAVSE